MAGLLVFFVAPCLWAGPNSPWSGFRKSIAIQEGNTVSAWDASGRSNMTPSGMAENMTPVGDGTYEYTFYLSPGTTYNFILFAYSTFSVTGLTANATYYDTVPNSGAGGMFTSTSTASITGHGRAWCGNVGPTGDSRRMIYVPPDLPGGSTMYVFCNFSSSPSVSSVTAMPVSSTTVRLNWMPYGSWGSGGESFKAADVIAGGSYQVYRSSVSAAGPYMFWISTTARTCDDDDKYSPGDNIGLEYGVQYYYVVVASDAYTGAPGQVEIPNMYRANAPEFSSADASAKTSNPVPVYFKVDGADWEYINKNGYLVYLTPTDEDARYFTDKKSGVAAMCLFDKLKTK